MKETPIQTVKQYVAEEINNVENIIIISELKNGNIVVTHNDLKWKDLMFLMKVSDDTIMTNYRRVNGNG